VRGLWRHRDHTGDEKEDIWVERSHLFLWLERSLPSQGLWELYSLREHLASCLPKPPLCRLNASVIQSSTTLPGNTASSSVDQDAQICASYSCKSPLTARLSCPVAKAFPGKAGTCERLSLHLHCVQRLEPACPCQSLVAGAGVPSKSLGEEERLGSRLVWAFSVGALEELPGASAV